MTCHRVVLEPFLYTYALRHRSTPPTLVPARNLHPTVPNDSRVLLQPRTARRMYLQTCGCGHGNSLAFSRAARLAVAKPLSLSHCWKYFIFLCLFPAQVQMVQTFNGGFLAVAFAVASFIGNFIFYFSGLCVNLNRGVCGACAVYRYVDGFTTPMANAVRFRNNGAR